MCAGIVVALPHVGMIRIPAVFLSAFLALTPIIGALCADGCIRPEAPRAVEVVPACGHGDAGGSAPLLSTATCAFDEADVVPAQVRPVGPALAPPVAGSHVASEPRRIPAYETYLRYQPPPPPAGVTLRI